MSAHYTTDGAIAVITLDNGAVNSMDLATRREIAEGLARAEDDPGVDAIVLVGAGRAFSGGADIKEFGTPRMLAEPNLRSLIDAAEATSKPVVAALHGLCMGGGLELALGCHYRIAAKGTRISLPEVKIGLVPGAGGTQRLPRAIDVETALNMIATGEPVTAEALAALPGQALIDRLVDGDVLPAAMAFAREVAAKRPLPRVRDRKATHANADGYFAFARATVQAMSKGLPAPLRCVDMVEAAVKQRFEEGLRAEYATFGALLLTPEHHALRHAFFAERATSKIADVPADTPLRSVAKVAVIGAGTMGGGISMCFLNAGIPVTMLEVKQEAIDRGVAGIRGTYEAQVKRGRMKPDKLAERMGLLATTLDYKAIADADLVIEAVFEDLGVKQKVFEALDAVMKPGAILASNTSTLDVDRIAAFTKRPAGCRRPALLLAGQHHEAAGGRARQGDEQGCARHRDGRGQAHRQDRGRVRRVRRLHRQPHDGAVHPAGAVHARRRRQPATDRQGRRELRLRDGAVPRQRSRRQRHLLGDPQAPLRRAAAICATAGSAIACASWAASARRPALAGTTTCRASAMRCRRPSWPT